MPVTCTPIRYPGGKTKIYPLIKEIMKANNLIGEPYAEVFAGGAGLAIKLLLNNDVSSIVINDYDRAVYSMWDAIVNHGEEMCHFVGSVDLTVEVWKKYREVYRNMDNADSLELGKAAFYLNRTNVSGILSGGLIGGVNQTGNYKMDVRFKRKPLQEKIWAIANQRDRIKVTNLDAEDFLGKDKYAEDAFIYLDPPYVKKGPGLYKSSFTEEKHRALAKKIADCSAPWVVTYDDNKLIDEIYSSFEQNNLSIRYSANIKMIGKEKIILSPQLSWPDEL